MPQVLPTVLPEQARASLQVQFDDMPSLFNAGGLRDIASTMIRLSTKHMKDYDINIEESILEPFSILTIGAGAVHEHLAKKYPGAEWFRSKEWFRFPVDTSCDRHECKDYVTNENENRTVMDYNGKFFHGCPFGAFLGMLAKGGFVAGEGACKKSKECTWGLLHDRFLRRLWQGPWPHV